MDLFSNPTNEAEGQVYLGMVVLNTDGSGNASQLFTLNNKVPNGHYITATASNAISGTSAFCTMTIVSEPLSVNMAPLLDPTADVLLNEVNEDASPPSGAVGTMISDLVDLNPPAGGNDNVSDPDVAVITGIAVIAAEIDNGAWFYSTDNGVNWFALGAVAIDSARLLAADGTTRIYFEPNLGFSGTVSSAIYFRAWDQTTGTNGDLADTSVHGGTSAFSLVFDSAAISVNTDYYLDGVGDGSDIPTAALKTPAPVDTTLDNFDPGRDTFAGLMLAGSDLGITEVDTTKYQQWITPAGGTKLNGPASLSLWSTMKDFDITKAGSITAYLVDSDGTGTDLTEIASATITRADWDVGNTDGLLDRGYV